jgi:SAM-dependent methyltransferase
VPQRPFFASVEWAKWVVHSIPRDVRSAVDLGCGKGILSYIIKSEFPEMERLVGVEIFEPYIDFAAPRGIFNRIVKWDLTKLPLPFGEKEFDVGICVDTLEHLPKRNSSALLSEIERIAGLVVVTTPNVWNPNIASTLDGNDYQLHHSVWKPSEFRRRGYDVKGIGDFKWGPVAVRFALGPSTYLMPEFSTTMLAIKGRRRS